MSNKNLKIGDKVETNGLLGPKIRGKITAIHIGYFYFAIVGERFDFLSLWKKHSENWLDEPVYTIEKYLPDFHVYLNSDNYPPECKSMAEARYRRFSQRYTSYLPCEIKKLPDDYDWTQEIENEINNAQTPQGSDDDMNIG